MEITDFFILFYEPILLEDCSKLWKWSFFGVFSRLGPFLQVFGQVKEWLILKLDEMIRIPHVVACPMNLICFVIEVSRAEYSQCFCFRFLFLSFPWHLEQFRALSLLNIIGGSRVFLFAFVSMLICSYIICQRWDVGSLFFRNVSSNTPKGLP